MLNVKEYLEFEYMLKKVGNSKVPTEVMEAYNAVYHRLSDEKINEENSTRLRITASKCIGNLTEAVDTSNSIIRKGKCLYILKEMKDAWRDEVQSY